MDNAARKAFEEEMRRGKEKKRRKEEKTDISYKLHSLIVGKERESQLRSMKRRYLH
jgi:hypothetical protein